jgi:Na+/citrate or Na+/malate symporter
MSISPKVYVPVLVAIVVGIALALITGDSTFLATVPISLVAGGAGAAAPPAPLVTHEEVTALSRQNQRRH